MMTENSIQCGDPFWRHVLDIIDLFDTFSLNWTVIVVMLSAVLGNVADNTALTKTIRLWILTVNQAQFQPHARNVKCFL